MENIKTFKACCKNGFNNNRYSLIVGIEYDCKAIKNPFNTIHVISNGTTEIFSVERFYEHFYTEKEYRKLKLQKLNEA